MDTWDAWYNWLCREHPCLCPGCTEVHSSVEYCSAAWVTCPKAEPEKSTARRWFTEAGLPGAAYRVVREREEEREPSQPMAGWNPRRPDSMGLWGWVVLQSHPLRTSVTFHQPGIDCWAPHPQGEHTMMGISRWGSPCRYSHSLEEVWLLRSQWSQKLGKGCPGL